MSSQHMAYQAYSQAFHTMGKTRQVVMLYDGIIRFLKQAREAIEGNRIEERFRLLVKASDVVLGLQACLDFENGGAVARVLYDFYSSVDARILTIQRRNDLHICDALIAELKEMREAWNAIDQQDVSDATPHGKLETSAGGLAALPPSQGMDMPASLAIPAVTMPFSSDIMA